MAERKFIKRKSMLEDIDFHVNRNLYCERKSLTNESSVEKFFIDKLLIDFGFKDTNIQTKESITKLTISEGTRRYSYKPDYCINIKRNPKFIIEAKSPTEDIFEHIDQPASYSFLINRKKQSIEYYFISNGIKSALYKWNEENPLIELNFEDFYIGNEKYEDLRKLISFKTLTSDEKLSETEQEYVTLKKISKEEAQKIFLSCHKYIWNNGGLSPTPAFTEFVKLIFLKLWNDRILHEQYDTQEDGNLKIPKKANVFSKNWIESREDDIANPLNDIQFKKLLEQIQDDIDKKHKKTIFDVNESIILKPAVIKGVVKKLEKVDLFGIDEDLNGRLFETFLNATMRGKALGQYFTPRSIVLLATLLADLQVTESHIDKVLDASCGTGGFLIEALTIMRNKVRENNSYTDEQKRTLIDKISRECMYGIDVATIPNLARIARINMYLHGDGGSHIYFANGLEKTIIVDKNDPHPLQLEIEDMKALIKKDSFDVILTNPPFSMWYEKENEIQEPILQEYKLLKEEGTNIERKRLLGSAMFIERYTDLLRTCGKLLIILDDTVLSSKKYKYVRDFIKEH